MIVLDACILLSSSYPADATLTMVRLLASHSRHELALPETALHEVVGHRKRDLASKIQKTKAAVKDLLGAAPSWDGREEWDLLQYPDMEAEASAHETALRDGFLILPFESEVLKSATLREIYRVPPAKTADKAGGMRDATIWLTTVNACRQATPSKVYFVTDNSRDFGEKGTLRPDLAEEAPENLIYCPGLDKLFEALATPATGPMHDPKRLLASANVREMVLRAITNSDVWFELMTRIPGAGAGVTQSAGRHDVELDPDREPTKVHSYELGDNVLIATDAHWRGQRVYVEAPGANGQTRYEVAFKFSTTIVAVLRDDGAIRQLAVAHRGPLRDIVVSAT